MRVYDRNTKLWIPILKDKPPDQPPQQPGEPDEPEKEPEDEPEEVHKTTASA